MHKNIVEKWLLFVWVMLLVTVALSSYTAGEEDVSALLAVTTLAYVGITGVLVFGGTFTKQARKNKLFKVFTNICYGLCVLTAILLGLMWAEFAGKETGLESSVIDVEIHEGLLSMQSLKVVTFSSMVFCAFVVSRFLFNRKKKKRKRVEEV